MDFVFLGGLVKKLGKTGLYLTRIEGLTQVAIRQ